MKFHFILYFQTLFVDNNLFGQELGLYKAQTKLPFNAFGTMAMAREVRIYSLTWPFFKHAANHLSFFLKPVYYRLCESKHTLNLLLLCC
jgi:hypothetical protein